VTLVKGDLRGIVRDSARQKNLQHHHAQHPSKSVLCLHLRLAGRAGSGRCVVSLLRLATLTHDRRSGDELQLGVGHQQCLEVTQD
jgi:hypothetical protein